MVVRSNALYQLAAETSVFVAVIGALTAIFAATIGLAQRDIKKVLAYSTVSQLGYMFLAAGLGAYSAAIFHLGTHAFFKACLFLGSGSVIHAMSGEQDMRSMGGLKKWMPVTYRTFWLSTLAIAGIPFFAGFFSKDAILLAAWESNKLLWAVGLITAGLTATYMFRAVYLTFEGDFRGTEEQRSHLHESPRVMTVPLIILAVGAVFGGFIGIPKLGKLDWNVFGHFLEPVIADVGHGSHGHPSLTIELILMGLSVAVAVAGILISRSIWKAKGPAGGEEWAAKAPAVHRLLLEKYRVDELYDRIVVRPLAALSQFFKRFVDGILVEGAVHSGPFIARLTGDLVRFTTTGNVRNYLLYFFVGLLALFWWVMR